MVIFKHDDLYENGQKAMGKRQEEKISDLTLSPKGERG